MLAPDRPEASAADCEHLAAHPETADRDRVAIAADLLWVPITHPLRDGDDRVLAMSAAIARRQATPEALRTFAGELRDGAAVMVGRGWMRTFYGAK